MLVVVVVVVVVMINKRVCVHSRELRALSSKPTILVFYQCMYVCMYVRWLISIEFSRTGLTWRIDLDDDDERERFED